jgi:hypothetical protein
MSETITIKQANELMHQAIRYEIECDFKGQSDVITCVNKCIKHIQCLSCLDTKKLLFESESWFGGRYEEFSCPVCTCSRDRKDSHHQIYHCKGNGRQVPYNGGDRNVGYSRVGELVHIYKREYEQHDFLVEESERKKAAHELDVETKRLELERIKSEDEERNKPSWMFVDSQEVCSEIGAVDASIDISKLVGDVTQLMAITAGNLVVLPPFLTALHISLKSYWANEKIKNSIFHKTMDRDGETVYIKFEYNKIKEAKKGLFGVLRFNANSSKERLRVMYFIAKPANASAERICTDLMNITIQSIVEKLKK